jgi:hypothetical protein
VGEPVRPPPRPSAQEGPGRPLDKPGMDQATIFATITTSRPQAVAALVADAGNDPATGVPDPRPPPPASPHRQQHRHLPFGTTP